MFFVADLLKDGLVLVSGNSFQEIGFIETGVGAHGLYPSATERSSTWRIAAPITLRA